jgi:Tol biopolymer transport system component
MLDFEATADLPCPVADRCPGGYGLGMAHASVGGWTAWQHSGSTGALLSYFPQRGITIAVLTTSTPGESAGPYPATNGLVAAIRRLKLRSGLFTVRADGSDRRPVSGEHEIGGAALSPDGTRIAYSTTLHDRARLVVADRDGGHPRTVAGTRGSAGRPAWSPDGARLAFPRLEGGRFSINVIAVDGSRPTAVTRGTGDDHGPAWSPDGSHVAYGHYEAGHTEIRVMRADGTEVRTLARFEPHGPWTGFPTWSTDGGRIAFTGDDGTDTDIQMVGVDGTGLTTLTRGHVPEQDPAWGPDGRLVYVRADDLYVTVPGRADSTRRLTRTLDHEWSPAWAPDGSTIQFSAPSKPTRRSSPG